VRLSDSPLESWLDRLLDECESPESLLECELSPLYSETIFATSDELYFDELWPESLFELLSCFELRLADEELYLPLEPLEPLE